MSYDAVIEQVRTLPESLLTTVSAFIKFLETEQNDFPSIKADTYPKHKEAFFDLAGKIHLDATSITELREASLI